MIAPLKVRRLATIWCTGSNMVFIAERDRGGNADTSGEEDSDDDEENAKAQLDSHDLVSYYNESLNISNVVISD